MEQFRLAIQVDEFRQSTVCNTVYYAVLLMMNDQIRSNKIDYKNCASRWSLTQSDSSVFMMYVTV